MQFAGYILIALGGLCVGAAALLAVLPVMGWVFFLPFGYTWREVMAANPESAEMMAQSATSFAIGLPFLLVGFVLYKRAKKKAS